METKYTFGVQKAFYFRDCFEFYFCKYEIDPKNIKGYALSPKGWVEKPEGSAVVPLIINAEDMIALADALWQNKIKPPEFFNSVGEQKATEKHLEDMRSIAFNKLCVPKP